MLYVNGDSWSFRTKECDFEIWPELVANNLNLPLCNESVGCGSNSRIVDCLKNQYLFGLKPQLMIFGLTAHHRYHLPAPELGSWVINPLTAREEHTGVENLDLCKFFVAHSYSDVDSIYRYYRDIWSIHELSEKFGCKYLSFQMWDSTIIDLDLLKNQETIYNYISRFYKSSYTAERYLKSLNSLLTEKNCWNYEEVPVASILTIDDYDATNHPNELGHKKIANYVMKLLTEYHLI